MRLIKMTGGLGNQMFIYAFYLQMKERFPHVYIDLSDMVHYNVHNGYEMHKVFNLPRTEVCMNQPLKKVLEFLFFKTILERKQKSMDAFSRKRFWPLVYHKGFYQSEKFFSSVKQLVRNTFVFDEKKASEKTKKAMEQIDGDKHAVSIHVRRGDYLQQKNWETSGCVCQLPYYKNAVREMGRLVESPSYYVFSDDISWVKENLPLEKAVYVDWNTGRDSWQDMMLMSHCRHHIICNSTFSWWGAWLNPRPDKHVLVPERWFGHCDAPDIYPEGWKKVSLH